MIDVVKKYEAEGFASEQEFISGLQRHSSKEPCTSAGIPLCYKDDIYFSDDGDGNTLIFGSTGTKKTRNFCIPGVFAIGMGEESMVISDPKAEIYRNTSGFLSSQGYNIQVINLREPEKGAKWNPLSFPYRLYKSGDTDRAIELISDFANQLRSQVHTDRDPYWENQAMDLLIGLILVLFECEENENNIHMDSIQHIRMYIKLDNGDEDSDIFWDLLKTFPANSFVWYKLSSIYGLRNTERTFVSVLSTFDAMIRDFLFNKKIMEMLDTTEIRFESLFNQKTALFLIIPDEKTTFHFLASVFIKQCYECLIIYAQEQSEGKLPRRIHFILDEFSNFPKITDMPAMISAARSRNMRFVLVVQSRQQLLSMYGDDAETIKSNCKNWIYLPCRELGLLREIQELCGTIYIEGKGEVPLVSMSKLQSLKVGWVDSQALILRMGIRPYIAWVKDFSAYPQAAYGELPIIPRKLQKHGFFSVPGYLYEHMKKQHPELVKEEPGSEDMEGEKSESEEAVEDEFESEEVNWANVDLKKWSFSKKQN